MSLSPGSRLASLHGDATSVVEHTTCNYGLNPVVDRIVEMGDMVACGIDDLGEVRAIELVSHPYFVATLYQPQLRSSPAEPHPLFVGLVEAAAS